ncbi:PucR family transcriptional regulator [Georgenia sp. 311]|uniref:PucR family transcriptional regulator n=1 Tax=Georgenia wutianyii TaxID=2585135 RepID=A0ABX5VLA8_9MICO|nr:MULTISPECIES: PucR family transcriptional regulator [Georgenia]QDB78963.1 PucR family transcriptional regulator [Georgenia wutianyii]TNC17214.1 PucR family transcriptional regulator [Georgenia sp. 311]
MSPASTPADRQDSSDVVRRLRGGTDLLTSAALKRLDGEIPWYGELAAEDRSWIGLVAQSGIAAFIAWYESSAEATYNAAEIFRAAPPELTRSISLQHTLQLVRLIVEVVEENAVQLAAPGQQRDLRDAVLRYSREVAFSAAEVYARAAEARGAWDARLEALVVDSLVRGDTDGSLRSRAAALGWSGTGRTVVLVGTTHTPLDERSTSELRRASRRAAHDALVGIQGDRLVIVLGGPDLRAAAESLMSRLRPGTVVIGPEVGDIAEAGRSARAALAGLLAAPAWPDAPELVEADELLPERFFNGDPLARRTLLNEIYRPLVTAGGPLLETLGEYLAQGRSLEGAARALYVHPNTVRYRLRRISQVVGWDATTPREAFVLQVALVVGRLSAMAGDHSGV